ncbi:hypothetical protein P168DRAFT_148662 [Aspergillus campestris IBT 28561]|uniref:Uncharacterized protein n=1 Tax=Aspergillus campestris (strain IBT 28561) TaxID=1392248 RepID=A0A2I1D5Z3_ASPC2|nr:uncharacterized protein P168DRAFT_148662 [Aspergillus campestris IBT 28561]PKY05297.1 hypothetical protein P168DRAFT_148662 [Aspergillus campestris IBT 28561]
MQSMYDPISLEGWLPKQIVVEPANFRHTGHEHQDGFAVMCHFRRSSDLDQQSLDQLVVHAVFVEIQDCLPGLLGISFERCQCATRLVSLDVFRRHLVNLVIDSGVGILFRQAIVGHFDGILQVFHLDRECPSRDVQHRNTAKVSREALGVESGGHEN